MKGSGESRRADSSACYLHNGNVFTGVYTGQKSSQMYIFKMNDIDH